MSKLYVFLYYLVILVPLTFFSCSKQKGVRDVLVNAENIVEQQPDSALRLLNTVLFPEDLNKSLFNKYSLLLLEAKDKNYKDITSDTVIFAVKDYYVRKKDYPNAAMAAFYCGRVWHERDNMEEAVKAYMEADNLADKTDNDNLKGLIQANLGILHRYHSSYDKAILFTKKATGWYDKAKNYKNEISSFRIIGDCFFLSKKIDSAFYYYNESLKLATMRDMPKLQSDVKESMGVAYKEQGLYEQAKKLFNEALAYPEDSVERARILLNIAQVYSLENNTDSLNHYLDRALKLDINNPWLVRTSYYLKSEIAEKNSRYQEALIYYKRYHEYNTKVFDNEKNNKLLEVQEKYDFEKIKNSNSQLIIKQQKTQIIFVLALLATLLTTGLVIFIFYRKSVQDKRLLMESKQKIKILQRMANDFSIEKHSFSNILLEQFDILSKTALITQELSEKEQVSGQKLLKKFNEIVYGKDTLDWNKLYQSMNSLKNGFYGKVRKKYPQLNEAEFRICCLTCDTGFSDKEIAIVLATTPDMVRKIRSKIRKKIGMATGEDFLVFFNKTIQ